MLTAFCAEVGVQVKHGSLILFVSILATEAKIEGSQIADSVGLCFLISCLLLHNDMLRPKMGGTG